MSHIGLRAEVRILITVGAIVRHLSAVDLVSDRDRHEFRTTILSQGQMSILGHAGVLGEHIHSESVTCPSHILV